jgi:hypothetical protein
LSAILSFDWQRYPKEAIRQIRSLSGFARNLPLSLRASVFSAKNLSVSPLRPFTANTKQKTADLTDAAEKKSHGKEKR